MLAFHSDNEGASASCISTIVFWGALVLFTVDPRGYSVSKIIFQFQDYFSFEVFIILKLPF